jgi:hypothetical protein
MMRNEKEEVSEGSLPTAATTTVKRKTEEHASIDLSDLTRRRSDDDVVAELSRMIIQCLQVRGALSLDNLAMILLAKKGDIQDVLDCLVTTPLIKMKRNGDEMLYQYREGIPQSESIDLSKLSDIKAKEQREVSRCAQRIRALKAELRRDPSQGDSGVRAKQLFYRLMTNHPSLKSDPLYSHISRIIFPSSPSS